MFPQLKVTFLVLVVGVVLVVQVESGGSEASPPRMLYRIRSTPANFEAFCELIFHAQLASCRRDHAQALYDGNKKLVTIKTMEQCCNLADFFSCLREISESTCAPENLDWLDNYREEISAVTNYCTGYKPESCPNYL